MSLVFLKKHTVRGGSWMDISYLLPFFFARTAFLLWPGLLENTSLYQPGFVTGTV
jgi:hypothetical protein